jgi:hypothetical protein
MAPAAIKSTGNSVASLPNDGGRGDYYYGSSSRSIIEDERISVKQSTEVYYINLAKQNKKTIVATCTLVLAETIDEPIAKPSKRNRSLEAVLFLKISTP